QPLVQSVDQCPAHRAVLTEVVDTDILVAGVTQLRDEIPADASGRAGDYNSQSLLGPVTHQMSTTSRPSSSSSRYARCGAPTTSTSDSRSTLSSGSKVGSGTYGSVQRTFAPLNWASLRSL